MNKLYLKTAAIALISSVSSVLFAQNVGINTSGANPSVNAILDLSTGVTGNNLGFLAPHVSLTALTTFNPPIANAAGAGDVGMLVYNTNAGIGGIGYFYWNGTTWVPLASAFTGTGTTNYLARWTSPTALNIGVSQDNGLEVAIAQSASAFGFANMLTVTAAATTEINAILGVASVVGSIGVIGGNTSTAATNAGVEGYIGTEALPANAAVAVYGLNNAGTGNQVGVEGNVTGASTNNYGSIFTATGATHNYAIIVPSASGNVGFGTATPQASAIVDFTNTNATGGTADPILWPENAAPATNVTGAFEGEEIYNSTTGCFQFYHSGVWQTAGCPCSTAPPAQTITPGCTKPFGGETTTYSTSVSAGASYNWTASSNDGTPTISGGGTATVTVTWPTYATTGTVTSALSNFCGSTITNFTTTITSDSMTGPSNIFTSTTNAGLYTVATGGSFAWSFLSGGAGCTIVSPVAQSTEVNTGGATTFTIQCVVTASGGTCTATLTMPVTVAACTGNITVDPNPLSSATTAWTFTTRRGGGRWTTTSNMTINTTANNDLVIVALTDQDGGNRFFNLNGQTPGGGSVTYQYNGGGAVNANQYQLVTSFYIQGTSNVGAAPIDIYYFLAPVAGTYSINVGEPNNYNNNQEMNFAVALTGFCSTVSAADIIGYTWGSWLACSSGGTGVFSSTVNYNTAAEPIGTYIFTCLNNIYITASGAQYFQPSSGTGGATFNYLQTNFGEPGVTNCTASIGGVTATAAIAIPMEVAGTDPNGLCTATIVGLVIH